MAVNSRRAGISSRRSRSLHVGATDVGRPLTPDGLDRARLPDGESGVMVNVVDLHEPYNDAGAPFRSDAIRGKLNSGEVVDDPRSRDRTGY